MISRATLIIKFVLWLSILIGSALVLYSAFGTSEKRTCDPKQDTVPTTQFMNYREACGDDIFESLSNQKH